MSKNNLKKKFSSFVSKLTPDQVREQLVLAYVQMEKCQQVLRGENVEPVDMMDNGESSDLELFYQCKKVREELDNPNQTEKKAKGKSITIGADIDTSGAIKRMKDIRKEMMKLHKMTKMHLKDPIPGVFVFKMEELFSLVDQFPKNPESSVYYLHKGRIHRNVLGNITCYKTVENKHAIKIEGYDGLFSGNDLYSDPEILADTVYKVISKHVSLSSDHEPAYFIDRTNRVFKAAKWYLEEHGIEHFVSLEELRKYLLENIIDDGKQE